MKNLALRASLVKSGILLGLFIFLIYAFAVDGSGGIGGTIASLFSGLVFLVGLFIALLISVVVIFAVYFGILYLYDPDVSKNTYGELKEKLSDMSDKLPLAAQCCAPRSTETASNVTVDNNLIPLQETQDKLTAQLAATSSSVDSLQKSFATLSGSLNTVNEELSTLGEKVTAIGEEIENKASTDEIGDSAKKLSTEIASLKGLIQPLDGKVTMLEEAAATGNGDNDDEGTDLQGQMEALQAELENIKKNVDNLESSHSSGDNSTPKQRILTYLDNEANEKQFVELIKEGVDNDLTYAQIDDLLNKSLPKNAVSILAEHPSLTKQFIRDYKQNV